MAIKSRSTSSISTVTVSGKWKKFHVDRRCDGGAIGEIGDVMQLPLPYLLSPFPQVMVVLMIHHDDVDVVVVCGTIFVLSRWPRQKQKADGTRATARAL